MKTGFVLIIDEKMTSFWLIPEKSVGFVLTALEKMHEVMITRDD
jgi:hypothetical protein|tara:strand:- start:112 stop:243 length:132 start_codon:yes stop_codon:yes gene_type:complete